MLIEGLNLRTEAREDPRSISSPVLCIAVTPGTTDPSPSTCVSHVLMGPVAGVTNMGNRIPRRLIKSQNVSAVA